MIAWCKKFFTVSFLLLGFSFGSTALAAPALPKSVEQIANKHYFREEAIILLYDKNVNYEKAFSCKKIMHQKNDIRTDALCASTTTKDVFTLTILDGKKGYPGYVLVCPAGFDQQDPYEIVSYAFQTDEVNFQGSNGMSYYMGRTNGWIKDFENIFLTADMGFTKMSCWGLNKR